MDVSTDLLGQLCALPTAAFLEDAVYTHVQQWARRRRNIRVDVDRYGNRLLSLAGNDPAAPRLVLVAHTDHPAFVAQHTDGRELRAEFRGGVFGACVGNAAVRFFAPDRERRLKVESIEVGEGDRLRGATFRLPRGAEVPVGTIGMWDFGPSPVKETRGRLSARACDDLAGVASALAALDLLRKARPRATVAVLLTRAEEIGFVGAIASVKDRGGLLKKSDRIISIETSAAQPAAPIGQGCVLRIGDRTSVFHSGFSYFLNTRGEALAKDIDGFRFRRALMPGGTCEGTVFDAFGYIAGAVCVPLGNYHNMDRENQRMGPEYIDLDDWRALVTFLADVGRHHHEFDGKATQLRERLNERFASHRHLYDDPAAPLEGERHTESR